MRRVCSRLQPGAPRHSGEAGRCFLKRGAPRRCGEAGPGFLELLAPTARHFGGRLSCPGIAGRQGGAFCSAEMQARWVCIRLQTGAPRHSGEAGWGFPKRGAPRHCGEAGWGFPQRLAPRHCGKAGRGSVLSVLASRHCGEAGWGFLHPGGPPTLRRDRTGQPRAPRGTHAGCRRRTRFSASARWASGHRIDGRTATCGRRRSLARRATRRCGRGGGMAPGGSSGGGRSMAGAGSGLRRRGREGDAAGLNRIGLQTHRS